MAMDVMLFVNPVGLPCLHGAAPAEIDVDVLFLREGYELLEAFLTAEAGLLVAAERRAEVMLGSTSPSCVFPSSEVQGCVAPPSTVTAWPVMKRDPSDARNSTMPSRSSGVSGRGMHWELTMISFCAGVTVSRGISVNTAPGRIAFAVIPKRPSSRASERVMPINADFDVV